MKYAVFKRSNTNHRISDYFCYFDSRKFLYFVFLGHIPYIHCLSLKMEAEGVGLDHCSIRKNILYKIEYWRTVLKTIPSCVTKCVIILVFRATEKYYSQRNCGCIRQFLFFNFCWALLKGQLLKIGRNRKTQDPIRDLPT